MAWIRQLPQPKTPGKPRLWAATVRLPSGKRVTETHKLKSIVNDWATDLETDIRRGDWIDPKAGETTVAELWERFQPGRRLEKHSRNRDDWAWRCHVKDMWEKTKIGGILKPDVTAWIVAMEREGKGAPTIEAAVGVLRALLEIAVDARLLRFNPARGLTLPPRPDHHDRIFEPEEGAAFLAALNLLFPGRTDAGLLFSLMYETGVRWEEGAAIPSERVDLKRRLIRIAYVLERDGTVREYPKKFASRRWVPFGDDLMPALRTRTLATPPNGLIVTASLGGALHYSTWHRRVWTPAMRAARVCGGALKDCDVRQPDKSKHDSRTLPIYCQVPDHGIPKPWPTPHDTRHTVGTRYADAGVPTHDIQALLGHADQRSTQRYVHSGDERFNRARAATNAVRTLPTSPVDGSQETG